MTTQNGASKGRPCRHLADIQSSKDRLAKIRTQEAHIRADIEELQPYGDMARRLIAEDEAVLWEQIRVHFPRNAGWAANLAAHDWLIALREDRLYALGKSCSYVSIADAAPTTTDSPPPYCANCKSCAFLGFRGENFCDTHKHRLLKRDICQNHEFDPRSQAI